VEATDQAGCWVDLLELSITIHSEAATRLPILLKLAEQPEAFLERIGLDVLFRVCWTYKIPLKKETIVARLGEPIDALIGYLRAAPEGRKLLEEHRLSNWQLYKSELFSEFR